MTFNVPDICAHLKHKAQLTELEECHVTMNGEDCPCTVCAEGSGIIVLTFLTNTFLKNWIMFWI